jgi:hypothetical protein
MPSLPEDSFAGAAFLINHLYRPLRVTGDASYSAIAECAIPIDGDTWFWTDDNAKFLELLSRPELWRRFPNETGEILRFLEAMCQGPFMFRRVSLPRLERQGQPGGAETHYHSLMYLRPDLPRGRLVAGVRFHDQRTADALLLACNYVAFTYGQCRYRLPVEKHIAGADTALNGDGVQYRFWADLRFTAKRRRCRLGRITYTYTIDARSPLIATEVSLDIAPDIEVSDAVLTVGHSGLAAQRYDTVATALSDVPIGPAASSDLERIDITGADYYQIRQRAVSADCLAIHSLSRTPGHLGEIELQRKNGELHTVVARYAFPGVHCGATLTAGEQKLLTSGGFYHRTRDYAALMRQAAATKSRQDAALDFSISYDYGALINALAKCFAVSAAGSVPGLARGVPDELRSRCDLLLHHYFENYVDRHEQEPYAIFSRDLAYVLLGVVTMYQATSADAYLRKARRLCDVLMQFELPFEGAGHSGASGFLMRLDSARATYVDCHSAALLALTQSARIMTDTRLAGAIERGLGAYCSKDFSVTAGKSYRFTAVATQLLPNRRRALPRPVGWGSLRAVALRALARVPRSADPAIWNFKAGLTLRFFNALKGSPDPALQGVLNRQRDRLALLETALRRQIEESITVWEDGVEIRCTPFSPTTNSETQPGAILGLFTHPCD